MKSQSKWVDYYTEKKETAYRIFCLPFAGGAASKYSLWKKYMPNDIEIVPIQIPGRESRIKEPLEKDLVCLGDKIAEVIRDFESDGKPFAIFGHSMGGILGFEVTKKLEEQECFPQICFISSIDCISLKNTPSIDALDDQQMLAFISQYGAAEDLTELQKYPKFFQIFMRIIRGDFIMLQNYTINKKIKISTPIYAFYSDEDTVVNKKSMTEWKKMTKNSFGCRCFSGNHFYLFDKSKIVIDEIISCIISRKKEALSNNV